MRGKISLKILLGMTFVLLAFFLVNPFGFKFAGPFQTQPAHAGFFDDDLDVFDEVLELVSDNYVYPPDFKKLFTAAIDAMVKTAEKENLSVTSVYSGKTLETNGKQFSYRLSFNRDENMEALQGVYDFVSREFKGKISKKDLEKAGIDGMMDSLDPYSLYMDTEEFEASMRDTEGQYGGVGMVITLVDNQLTVVRVIKNSPSSLAGILPQDIITRVDGQEIKGMQIHELAAKLRGYPNTQVDIDVYRPSTKVTQLTTLTRKIISIETVQYKYLGDHTGYIRISSFSKQTNDQLEEALEKGEKDGVQAVVLDLRDNPGGLLSQSVKVVSHFLEEGQLVVYTQGRDRNDTQQYESVFNDRWSKKPLAVLINSHSASASEIVSGSLKDSGKALILGERSYGKGSVQTIFRMSDASGLRLTTSKYYTPSGIDITVHGIAPEIQVERDITGLPNDTPPTPSSKSKDVKVPVVKPIVVKESEIQEYLKKRKETLNDDTDLLVAFAKMAINNPAQPTKSHALAKARELAKNMHHY
jgi:carboxyl-terminal processing protease